MTENFQGLWSLSFDGFAYTQSVAMRAHVLHLALPSSIMIIDCQSGSPFLIKYCSIKGADLYDLSKP